MRFLEKHCNSILQGKDSPLARGVVPVDVTDASDWWFSQRSLEKSIRDTFPCVLAPHPVTFVEYKLPLNWVGENPRTKKWERYRTPHGPSDYFGMLIVQELFTPGQDPEAVTAILENVNDIVQIQWKQYTFCFAGNANDRSVMFWAENYVDAQGRMLGGPIHGIHASLVKKAEGDEKAAAAEAVSVYCMPAYFALALQGSGLGVAREQTVNRQHLQKQEKLGNPRLDYFKLDVKKVRSQANSNLSEAIKLAETAWKSVNPLDYVQWRPGQHRVAEELKTYQFKIQ